MIVDWILSEQISSLVFLNNDRNKIWLFSLSLFFIITFIKSIIFTTNIKNYLLNNKNKKSFASKRSEQAPQNI